jgi:hypothetical protein
MSGPIQSAVRASITSGMRLTTPAQGKPFSVARVDGDGIVLLLGDKEAWTPVSWDCLEGISMFLRARGWVEIGSRYDTSADPATLDGYLKRHLKRATAGWIAAVLERAGVVEVDRGRPARVRLNPGFVS